MLAFPPRLESPDRLAPASASLRTENCTKIVPEAAEDFQPLRSRLQNLLFGLKYLAAPDLQKHPNGFSHAPSRGSQHLQPVH